MAKAFPSLILDCVLKQLEYPIFQSNGLLNIQFRDMKSKLELIRGVMDEAEWMGFLFPCIVGKWLCELQALLYRVHDLLDETVTPSMTASSNKVWLHLHSLPLRLAVAPKMKTINKRLDSIVDECYKCNLIAVHHGSQKPIQRKGILRYDPDYVKDDEFYMFGREDKKEVVIRKLTSVPMLCLIGGTGVGKSTVCRGVYNDEEVSKHFHVRLWVGLGGTLTDRPFIDLWKEAIKIALGADEAQPHLESENKDQVIDQMVSLLEERRTLLILDDIPRRTNLEGGFCLEDVHDLFRRRAGHVGSWILMSSLFDPGDPIPRFRILNDIEDDHAWSILKTSASVPVPDMAGHLPWKIDLGKQIASSCEGFPAIIRAVGTLLYGNDNRGTWEYLAHNRDLKRRYQQYPLIRNMCGTFSKSYQSVGYSSLFLSDEVKLQTIIQQLTAHGFANLLNAQRMSEDLFARITTSLDWDSLGTYQIGGKGLKDPIQLLGGEESTILQWMDNDLPETTCHICIERPSSTTYQPQQKRILPDSLIKNAMGRRTLLFLGMSCPMLMSVQTLNTLASNLRYLRVLDLQDLGLQELPSSVGKLIQLKYLDLSRNNFRVLPKSVCQLKKLETLKLIYCDKLVRLSRGIKSLGHLKHLEINMCLDLTHMPSKLAGLTCLTRLDRFVVGPYKGGLKYLEKLDNLGGNLSIELPRQWKRSKIDAEQAHLERKKGLTAVEFKWQGAANGDDKDDDYGVLAELKPCSSIESLLIFSFGGTKLPSWISYLDRLSEITISHCKRCEILPPFHRLPKLRSLTLTSMNMEHLQEENNHDVVGVGDASSCVASLDATEFFPSLEVLKIGRMNNLKGWWSGDAATITKEFSKFREVRTLEIWNCPRLEIMHPFSMIRDGSIFHDVSDKVLQYIDWDGNKKVEVISIRGMDALPREFVARFPETLKIKDCNQLQMLWADQVEGTQVSRSLEYLSISNCPAWKHLSSNLRYLTNLKRLSISKCSENLDCLSNDDGVPKDVDCLSNDDGVPKDPDCLNNEAEEEMPWGFDCLYNEVEDEISQVRNCGLYKEVEDGTPWKTLRRLERLKIKGFECLVSPPEGLLHIPLLRELDIKDCKALKNFSSILRHLTRLRGLKISKCSNELDCLYKEDEDGMPWKSLIFMNKLTIEGFDSLVRLPKGLKHLTLRELHIKDCKALKHLSSTLSYQGQLLNLTISKCSEELDCLYKEEEDGMPWKAFRRSDIMNTLKIEGFDNLVALPKGMKHLGELFLLKIIDCKALKWETGSLPKIHTLAIKSCPHLSKIIEELKREHVVWSE